ncbi:dipeptide epimerase [Flavobacterium silvaticum]|uniref:Dipeptide epimerase n=1 Tax=Flavobacterium silvaticum TaxID=1852020 RepID=A0A972FNU1_9FLAO|nr:dipeptide epimerase [Flavobacterium silvaticum]NMH26674.1 dipeptide epimerase [Flavobacterium silvaticum]
MALTLSYRFFDLPLKHPFTISRYTVEIQQTVIAIISDGEMSGYGEATANPYYHSTRERIGNAIEKLKPLVSKAGNLHPSELWPKLEGEIPEDYFALCAVDVAYWDYYSRKQKKRLRDLLSDGTGNTPLTSYTIGIDTLPEMKRKVLEMPWPLYKVKLGRPNDMEMVRELRSITDSTFRIDANASWTKDQALENSKMLAGMNVEFIEQPLSASDVDGMKRLKKYSPLPLVADESCQTEQDVLLCADQFHGINIKLMKCGGITPALRMIDQARELGLKVMAGCMTESTIGISALCQLAGLLDYIDADGALLLASDIAVGVSFSDGKIIFSENDGTGAESIGF